MTIMLVQSASAKASSGTTVTVTLGSDTTEENCLVIKAGSGGSSLNTVSGITIGGSADNFALAKKQTESSEEDLDCEIWTDQDLGQASESVVITYGATITDAMAWAEEWSGVETSGAVDKTNGGSSSTTSWSSGASGTLSQDDEVLLGAVTCWTETGAPTITGPASDWTNLAQVSEGDYALGAAYWVVSADTSETYSGTQTGFEVELNAAAIVSLKASSGTPQTDTASLTVTPVFTAAAVHGHYRTASLTVEPSFTADRARGRYRTASLTVEPSFTADRSQGHVRSASLTVDPSFTAGRTQAHVRTASLTVSPVFTAAGQVSGAQSRTASLTITPAFTATAVINRQVAPTVRYPYHHRAAGR